MTLPAPSSSSGTTGGGTPRFPFIKVENLSSEPSLCKVIAVDTRGTGFNNVVVKVSMNGQVMFLGLKNNSPVYQKLFEELGADEAKWTSEEFYLVQEWNEFYNRNFIGYGGRARSKKGK